jgi:hypothetical protein
LSIETNPFHHHPFSILWFSLPFLALFYVLIYQSTPADEKENSGQTEGSEEDDD